MEDYIIKKMIKKYGDTYIISFTREDMKVWELKEGNIIRILIPKIKKEV